MIGTITAHGKTYEAIEVETVSAVRAKGRGNTAAAMEKAGIAQTYTAKLLRGKAIYQMHQYKDGHFSKPIKVA